MITSDRRISTLRYADNTILITLGEEEIAELDDGANQFIKKNI